jgi:hypothetical protein
MASKRKAIRGPRQGNKTLQPQLLNDPVGGYSAFGGRPPMPQNAPGRFNDAVGQRDALARPKRPSAPPAQPIGLLGAVLGPANRINK